jgi:DNA-binding response OmpR family regulator
MPQTSSSSSAREKTFSGLVSSTRRRSNSRAELLLEVWGIDFDPGTNVVDVHVARLRRKLERTGAAVIQTSRGEGYRIAPVSEWEKQAPRT